VAFLNAGFSTTSVGLGGPAWDLAAYRRAFGINVDGGLLRVALARALGPALAADHIAVNALCPGLADTAIDEPVQHLISAAGIPLMTADEVADALLANLAGDRTGEAW
jgi:hypothetical protein